jgi:hypothetical protein
MSSSQIAMTQAPSNATSWNSALLEQISAIVKTNNVNLHERESALVAAQPKSLATSLKDSQDRRILERRRYTNMDKYQRIKLMELLNYAGELLSSGQISAYTYTSLVTIASSTFIEVHIENTLSRYMNKL